MEKKRAQDRFRGASTCTEQHIAQNPIPAPKAQERTGMTREKTEAKEKKGKKLTKWKTGTAQSGSGGPRSRNIAVAWSEMENDDGQPSCNEVDGSPASGRKRVKSTMTRRTTTRSMRTSTASMRSRKRRPTERNRVPRPLSVAPSMKIHRSAAPQDRAPCPANRTRLKSHRFLHISGIRSRAARSGFLLPRHLHHPDVGFTTIASLRSIRKSGTTAICAGSSRSEPATIRLTKGRVNLFRGWTRRKLVLARGNGSKGFGDAEQSGRCDIGKINAVDDESFQFDQGSSQHEENSFPTLKLRGGAGGPADGRKSSKLEDDARVPAAVWFLAGKVGPPPTGKQLRDRRAKEEAYVQRKQAEAEALREARKAKRELKKAGVKIEGEGEGKGKGVGRGGLWKNMFGKKKKKTEKTRGDEEAKEKGGASDEEKEVADEG